MTEHKIFYSHMLSALKSHDNAQVPEPMESNTSDFDTTSVEASAHSSVSIYMDEVFSLLSSSEPHLISQTELNDFFHGFFHP